MSAQTKVKKPVQQTDEKAILAEVKRAKAIARNVRQSSQKTRLVADLIRGKHVAEALAILQNLHKRAALPVMKVTLSAVANAENLGLDKELLTIVKITVDQGTPLQRWQPRARGSAFPIRRPTCHIVVELKENGKKRLSLPVFSKRPRRSLKGTPRVTPEEAAEQMNRLKETAETIAKTKKKRVPKEAGKGKTIKNRLGLINRQDKKGE